MNGGETLGFSGFQYIEVYRAPADREVSIKDSGFTRTGLGVTVLSLHTASDQEEAPV